MLSLLSKMTMMMPGGWAEKTPSKAKQPGIAQFFSAAGPSAETNTTPSYEDRKRKLELPSVKEKKAQRGKMVEFFGTTPDSAAAMSETEKQESRIALAMSNVKFDAQIAKNLKRNAAKNATSTSSSRILPKRWVYPEWVKDLGRNW